MKVFVASPIEAGPASLRLVNLPAIIIYTANWRRIHLYVKSVVKRSGNCVFG